MEYSIKHYGQGKFLAILENGETKEVGSNLRGIIRYTYFEDYVLPEIGWEITRTQLMADYLPKVHNDILAGKIKPNQLNY